ncbi:hypothetical protein CEXT_382271 [Caerostris extrusa]|uniref:Uncharacterized protein n=1 Tax=Caerostris extrusa TaxID=172846 RepID=A0AAV4NKX1_CAEEX|nr:hypothetical protein CEXT_382271 [Caerostris extrusa]
MPAASRGQPSYTDYLGGRAKDNIAICSFPLFVETGGFECLCCSGGVKSAKDIEGALFENNQKKDNPVQIPAMRCNGVATQV